MVFHYTNFVFETNAWWLRRIRPLWMSAVGAGLFVAVYRYYFFGKIQAYNMHRVGEEEMERRAKTFMRDYGYDSHYKPKLERSIKKKLMEAQGENYRFVEPWAERFMGETRSLEEVLEEENNYE